VNIVSPVVAIVHRLAAVAVNYIHRRTDRMLPSALLATGLPATRADLCPDPHVVFVAQLSAVVHR